jgi:uncharacterized protein
MDKLKEFDVEFIKLKEGDHQFEYHLTDTFFEAFNSSLSTQGIDVFLTFTKSSHMFTLAFNLKGIVTLDCDRCLRRINLPIEDKHTVLVKITDQDIESEDDLLYISSHDYKLNIAQHIYDFVNLSIPIKKTCTDIGEICDKSVTDKISSVIDIETVDNTTPDRDSDNEEDQY